MMIVNLVVPAIAAAIAFLILALDHIWRDKRTRGYRRVRFILIGLIALATILNVGLAYDNQKKGNHLQQTIDALNSKVATLENQNRQLSILERMQRYITTDYDVLSRKYPKGYFLFATNKYVVLPSRKDAKSSFTLDWSSSRVAFMDDSFIYITLKDFHYYPNEIKVENLNIVLQRKIGATADGIFFNGVGLAPDRQKARSW
jgi:hypothetical protein